MHNPHLKSLVAFDHGRASRGLASDHHAPGHLLLPKGQQAYNPLGFCRQMANEDAEGDQRLRMPHPQWANGGENAEEKEESQGIPHPGDTPPDLPQLKELETRLNEHIKALAALVQRFLDSHPEIKRLRGDGPTRQ